MTTGTERWLLRDYIEQEIRECLDNAEEPYEFSRQELQRITNTIAGHVDSIISDQITNALF